MIQPVQEGGWEYSALKFVLDLVYISQSQLIFNIYCKSCLQESQIKQDNTTDQNLKFAKLKLQLMDNMVMQNGRQTQLQIFCS